jgi:nitroimidazol reductase NimA-like FMN-containing flavoprotein (pyridoxamine 5'-phosphate oxidase superfamily)
VGEQFRKVARFRQQLSRQECVSILKQQKRGVLAVLGDFGYPYALPINHWYNEQDGCLYFHSGRKGHKIDAMAERDKVSFCVYDEGYRNEGEWWLNIRSVIAFGRVQLVEDHQQALEISRQLSYQFTQDEAYIQHEIEKSGSGVAVYRMEIAHMTGKLVHER